MTRHTKALLTLTIFSILALAITYVASAQGDVQRVDKTVRGLSTLLQQELVDVGVIHSTEVYETDKGEALRIVYERGEYVGDSRLRRAFQRIANKYSDIDIMLGWKKDKDSNNQDRVTMAMAMEGEEGSNTFYGIIVYYWDDEFQLHLFKTNQ